MSEVHFKTCSIWVVDNNNNDRYDAGDVIQKTSHDGMVESVEPEDPRVKYCTDQLGDPGEPFLSGFPLSAAATYLESMLDAKNNAINGSDASKDLDRALEAAKKVGLSTYLDYGFRVRQMRDGVIFKAERASISGDRLGTVKTVKQFLSVEDALGKRVGDPSLPKEKRRQLLESASQADKRMKKR